MPLMEFDPDGHFIRGFGDGLFDRPHGLRIDAQDNIWATDVAAHLVYKSSIPRVVKMVLGCKNRPGEWHEFGHLRLFNEPNEAVVGPTGDLQLAHSGLPQAHPRIRVRTPPPILPLSRQPDAYGVRHLDRATPTKTPTNSPTLTPTSTLTNPAHPHSHRHTHEYGHEHRHEHFHQHAAGRLRRPPHRLPTNSPTNTPTQTPTTCLPAPLRIPQPLPHEHLFPRPSPSRRPTALPEHSCRPTQPP